MRKNIVRLTESQLRDIVKEATIKILSEGKVVNNKPYFDRYYSDGSPMGKKAKPGQELYMRVLPDLDDDDWDDPNIYKYDDMFDPCDWDLKGNMKSRGIEYNPFTPEQIEYMMARMKDGHVVDPDTDEYYKTLPETEYSKLWNAMKKHNDRIENYKSNDSYPESHERSYTLWGSRESDEELAKDRAWWRNYRLKQRRGEV